MVSRGGGCTTATFCAVTGRARFGAHRGCWRVGGVGITLLSLFLFCCSDYLHHVFYLHLSFIRGVAPLSASQARNPRLSRLWLVIRYHVETATETQLERGVLFMIIR